MGMRHKKDRIGELNSFLADLRVLPVLHRPEVVDIGVNTMNKNMPYAKGTIYFNHF